MAQGIGDSDAADRVMAGNSVILIDATNNLRDDCIASFGQLIKSKESTHFIAVVATSHRLLQLQKQLASNQSIRMVATISLSDMQVQLDKGTWNLLIITQCLLQRAHLLDDVNLGGVFIDQWELMNKYTLLVVSRLVTSQSTQLLITSTLWQSQMNTLIKSVAEPLLVFHDKLEAAVYNDISFEMEICEDLITMIELLRAFLVAHPPEVFRTLIYCNGEAQVALLLRELAVTESVLLHRGRWDIGRVSQWQQHLNGNILVLGDHAPELRIDNVHSLIHFGLPSEWSKFKQRFAVFNAADRKQPLNALCLFDEESKVLLPHAVQFMQKHELPLSAPVEAAHAQWQRSHEQFLIDRKCVVCPVLLLHGQCDTPTCRYRHKFADYDRAEAVPTAGVVRFQLLKVCSPTLYAGRLLAHREISSDNWKSLPHQQLYEELQQHLITYYEDPVNYISPTSVRLQDVCVRRMGENSFERVTITFIANDGERVRVRHLDTSSVICHAKVNELLMCPNDVKHLQPLSIDVRCMGIVPINGERSWQSTDIATVAKLIPGGGIFEANVEFVLAHTIFVDDLQLPVGKFSDIIESYSLGKFVPTVKCKLMQLYQNNFQLK